MAVLSIVKELMNPRLRMAKILKDFKTENCSWHKNFVHFNNGDKNFRENKIISASEIFVDKYFWKTPFWNNYDLDLFVSCTTESNNRGE